MRMLVWALLIAHTTLLHISYRVSYDRLSVDIKPRFDETNDELSGMYWHKLLRSTYVRLKHS